MNIGFSRGFRHTDDYVSMTKLGNTIGAAESKTSRTKKKKCGPPFYKVLVGTVNDWPVYCRLSSTTAVVAPELSGWLNFNLPLKCLPSRIVMDIEVG
jgi:hypothetical protein